MRRSPSGVYCALGARRCCSPRAHRRRTGSLRLLLAVVILLGAACTPGGQGSTTARSEATAPTGTGRVPTSAATSTTAPPVSTTGPTATTTSISTRFEYAVVAEERSRRLAVIDPSQDCADCGPVMTVELPDRPHNLAAIGPVVYATHPGAGSVSRAALATGEVLTVRVGTEPHDIKPARIADGAVLVVADEAGGRLLTLDPDTLEVTETIDLPGEPHDLVVTGDVRWVTLTGQSRLARVEAGQVELVETGGSPHDLILDQTGRIWFSNWNSHTLSIFDPAASTTREAPAGVSEPHHFAVGPDGRVWVSDNGGGAVVGFEDGEPRTIEVGPVPHHLGFVGDSLVVAVSQSGEAVVVRDDTVVVRVRLTPGLHGVAVVTLAAELGGPG